MSKDIKTTPSENIDPGIWSYLKSFRLEVTSPTNILFSNYRQWVEIQIVVDARNEKGEPVVLDKFQLQSIRLIEYVGGKELPLQGGADIPWVTEWYNSYSHFLPYPAASAIPFSVSHGEEEADLRWPSSPAELALFENEQKRVALDQERQDIVARNRFSVTSLEPTDVLKDSLTEHSEVSTEQYIRFYVRTRATSKLRVAAKISRLGGATFTTNTPNPGQGEFDSSVELIPEAPRRYIAEDFLLECQEEIKKHGVTVDLYYISLINKLKIVTISLGNTDGYFRYFISPHNPFLNYAQYAFGSDLMQISINTISGDKVSFPINELLLSQGKANAACAKGTLVSGSPPFERSAEVTYMDQYGNGHKVWIVNVDNNSLKISDLPAP